MRNIRNYLLDVIEGEENSLKDLTGTVINRLDAIVEQIIVDKKNNELDNLTLENRTLLSKKCMDFHQKAGTLTTDITLSLQKICKPETILLEAAHQPNFLPYAGFFQKILIMNIISEKLTKKGFDNVQMFGLLDTDTVRSKWTRSTLIRDPSRKGNSFFFEM